MATDRTLAERSGNLLESHKGYDPRVVLFYFVIAGLLLVLTAGLAYQQLHRIGLHSEHERLQNMRRILIPGPRGNIYDRHGVPLVTNSPRWTVVLHLDELRAELRREYILIHNNYAASTNDKKELPSQDEISQIARVAVAQRYLDQVNRILGENLQVDRSALTAHFSRELLLPFTLLDDLKDGAYARLIERLPVNSPLQVYATFTRSYPFKSAAAHALGYVKADTEVQAEDFPGEDLTTFKMRSTRGRDGLEKTFDAQLQGEAGGKIFRVDPAGYRINKPIEQRAPKQGKSLVTSLDIDLQQEAETKLTEAELPGAGVAIDVATGEVLVLASKPDYDLNDWYPRMSTEKYRAIQEQGAEVNLAVNGVFSPGSTFKILVSIAGMRSGRLQPDDMAVNCTGVTMIGRSPKKCDNGNGIHGQIDLADAITCSCDIYFYLHGIEIGPNVIAAEARRFHLDRPTGIELPFEEHRMNIPDPEWKRRTRHEAWTDGDTANMAIGQGGVDSTPLLMACFAASVARGEVFTQPTLLHDPNRPRQHTESIGLTPEQRAVIIAGMEGVVTKLGHNHGTASSVLTLPKERIPGVVLAGKTGTAQYGNKQNVAWFICFAPAEQPEIAIAVALESGTLNAGEDYQGGRNAAPIANAILKKYFEAKAHPPQAGIAPLQIRSSGR